MRWTAIPHSIDQALSLEWNSLSEPKRQRVIEAILKISNHFQSPDGLDTPWEEENHFLAYKLYFFPLNLARGQAVFQSLQEVLQTPFANLYDIGAGLGNLKVLQQYFPSLLKGEVTSIEKSNHPSLKTPYKVIPHSLPDRATAFFSFSWVEAKTPFSILKLFENLIFIEPSTSIVARKLMSLRHDLLEQGFEVLAPCTHKQGCPLLIHSKKDWCHDRVHFQKSDWFVDLEGRLPMKNNTLTFSYLVMSKTKAPTAQGKTRVIGDTLKEKGKSRQAICFDDQRRFLSWLKKDHPDPEQIDHGALIEIQEGLIKGAEVRVTVNTQINTKPSISNND